MKTKFSEYMDINRIEFIVTWQCGGKCKHCQIGDEINKRSSHRHVLSDYAVEATKKISTVFDVTSVMTFGGEPLYYPYVTAAIHKAATDRFTPKPSVAAAYQIYLSNTQHMRCIRHYEVQSKLPATSSPISTHKL